MSVADAYKIYEAGVQVVQPSTLMREYLSLNGDDLIVGTQTFKLRNLRRVLVVGAGKASAAMAKAVEDVLYSRIDAGLVITKHNHSLSLDIINCLEGGHPVPDLAGLKATASLVALLSDLGENDLVIFLVSGGASALLVDCPNDIGLDDLQHLVQLLLSSGANIDEINCVRKHMSGIKGGQLSKVAYPASLVALILSDVNGDDLSVIASGPTEADHSTFKDAMEVLERYKLRDKVSPGIVDQLRKGVAGLVAETLKPGDPYLQKTTNILVGTNKMSLLAAKKKAEQLGYHAVLINDRLEGEAGLQAADFVQSCLLYNGPRPACLLMGGETTVTVTGSGLGGRNQHFVLAALAELLRKKTESAQFPVILSGGTDGTDGPTDATGAVIDGRLLVAETEVLKYLEENDAYHFFEKHGGLIKTGPTQTNVMDIVIGLVY